MALVDAIISLDINVYNYWLVSPSYSKANVPSCHSRSA